MTFVLITDTLAQSFPKCGAQYEMKKKEKKKKGMLGHC